MSGTSRRGFLQQGILVGGALAVGKPAWSARNASNDINVGVIGLGGRGANLIGAFSKVSGVKIGAICDPDSARVAQLSEKLPGAKKFTDLRALLDLPEIDAVVIATCNHWHCLTALWAMEAGKHVYVEKPLANAQWEGEQVVKAAEKHQKICAIGTQQRSAPMQAEIKKILFEERLLGSVEWVRVNRFGVRQSIGKRKQPLTPPATLDYNLWLGPAADQPIYRKNLHYDWHWDWNTGAGEMGNWGVHIMDDVRNNIFQDQIAYPKRVLAAGGRFGWQDAGTTPNVHFGLLDTGSIPVVVALTNLPEKTGGKKPPKCPGPWSGYIAYCAGGRIEGQRGSARVFDAAGKLIRKIDDVDGMTLHQQNFVDAIRNNSPESLNAPVKVGHHSTGWCNMVNYGYRAATVSDEPGSISALASQLGSGTGITSATDAILADLAKVAQQNNGSTANMAVGPLLSVDATSGEFVGARAESANRYMRVEGRGKFVVKAV